ncbi:hypothetical protein ACSS6W_006113 [Trichoderma asperelloides]
MDRLCSTCSRNKPRSSYRPNEWHKGPGLSQCTSCLHGHASDNSSSRNSSSGRYNESNSVFVSESALEKPFAQGAFRLVAKGIYISGPRQGEYCVIKWFKSGVVFSDTYFTLDIKAVNKALEIVDKFNKLNLIDKVIKVNIPEVWHFTDDSPAERAGQRYLCEPFIQNYQKFNSNTGWNDSSIPWGKVMQALSHFSYHISGGKYVLCDLQGGIYRRGAVLSDPAILSRNRDYGVTDLGPDGISSFFRQHTCNDYCRSGWIKPGHPTRRFNPVRGTTMIRHAVPARNSRP